MRPRIHKRARDERGAATVETVLLIPAVLLVLAVMVAGFRIWDARTQVGGAADAAARAASLSPSAAVADRRATQIAAANLSSAGVDCVSRQVSVDTSGFSVRVGHTAQVRVSISCRVPLGDLLVPGLPGHLTIEKAGVAGLDRYRARGR